MTPGMLAKRYRPSDESSGQARTATFMGAQSGRARTMSRLMAGQKIDAATGVEKVPIGSWLIGILLVFLFGVTIVGSIVLYVGP